MKLNLLGRKWDFTMMNWSLSDEDELKPGHLMMKMEPSQNTDLSARKMRQSGRHTFTSSVLNRRLGSIRVLFQSVCPRWFRWWRRSSADVTAVFKSMTSLHMTASPRSGPTRQKTRRILVDAAVWMFQADRGASGAAGQLPPHRGEDGGRGCQSASRFQNETTGQRWQNPKIHDTREDVSLRSFN